MRQQAFQMALASAAQQDRLQVLDDLEIAEIHSAKALVSLLGERLLAHRRTLLIVPTLASPIVQVGQNIPQLLIRSAQSVRTTDVLLADRILMLPTATAILGQRTFGTENSLRSSPVARTASIKAAG
jgi:ribosomal protein L4